MALDKFTTDDVIVRLSSSFKSSEVEQIALYAGYYKSLYGHQVSVLKLVPKLAVHATKDKEFQAWVKTLSDAQKAAVVKEATKRERDSED
jgi:hypothetical protein